MSARENWLESMEALRESVVRQRGRRAEERQRAFQIAKAHQLAGSMDRLTDDLVAYATSVKTAIERVRPIAPNAQVLEVGCGAHGLIFFLGLPDAIGIDPLADDYAALFPEWQARAKTIRGYGEKLPFDDESFDLVLSDNVIDHAERPQAVLGEIVRVLRPGGTFYFTVHVHHSIYAAASLLHAAWNAVGIRYEVTPFADHTVHFTLSQIRARIRALPLRVLSENTGIDAARQEARDIAPRHTGDRLKRLFFKNARFEIVAVRS